MISVSINGAKAERTIVDTGAAGAFLIFDYFARRYPNALVDHGGIGSRSPEQRFFGVGGAFATKPYAIESVRLGQVNFRDFVVYRVMSSGSYVSNEDGLFGPKLLSLFDVHFDYPNGMMYLVPNANFDHSRA